MAKKFKNTRCTYCLKHFEELTSDHVFPRGWYPETTPKNLEKWQVPACEECNTKYSKVEGELLQKIGLCIAPDQFAALGIADKVLRSLNPKHARDSIDRRYREKGREKILKNLIPAVNSPLESIVPGFGLFSGTDPREQYAIPVPKSSIDLLGEKLIRGFTYEKHARYIEADHEVSIWVAHEEHAKPLIESIRRHGAEYHQGPGIKIGAAYTPEDPISGIFEIIIWGKLRLYGAVLPIIGKS
jgi:hypothetical protein